jgi:hypothetical protein
MRYGQRMALRSADGAYLIHTGVYRAPRKIRRAPAVARSAALGAAASSRCIQSLQTLAVSSPCAPPLSLTRRAHPQPSRERRRKLQVRARDLSSLVATARTMRYLHAAAAFLRLFAHGKALPWPTKLAGRQTAGPYPPFIITPVVSSGGIYESPDCGQTGRAHAQAIPQAAHTGTRHAVPPFAATVIRENTITSIAIAPPATNSVPRTSPASHRRRSRLYTTVACTDGSSRLRDAVSPLD